MQLSCRFLKAKEHHSVYRNLDSTTCSASFPSKKFGEINPHPLQGWKAFWAIVLNLGVVMIDFSLHIVTSDHTPIGEMIHNAGDLVVIAISIISLSPRKQVLYLSVIVLLQYFFIGGVIYSGIQDILFENHGANKAPLILGGIAVCVINLTCNLFVRGETLHVRYLQRCFIADSLSGATYALTAALELCSNTPFTLLGPFIVSGLIVWAISPIGKECIQVLMNKFPVWLSDLQIENFILKAYQVTPHIVMMDASTGDILIVLPELEKDEIKKLQDKLISEFGHLEVRPQVVVGVFTPALQQHDHDCDCNH